MFKFTKYCLLLILISAVVHKNIAQQKFIPILPEPQQYELTSEKFEVKDENFGFKLFCEPDVPILQAIDDLNNAVIKYHNAKISEGITSKKKLIIGRFNVSEKFDEICKSNDIYESNNIGEEGYQLLINEQNIIISADGNKGIFYGIQSLIQLIRGNKNQGFLPGLSITDYPAFKYRSVMDDISRGPIPTLDYMKYQIRRLAEMKINTIIQYVEHVVKTESYPEFAPDDGSLTIDEWREIADYALNYNITIIGGFQSFGHFQKILETPEYAHLGESGSLISPLKEESYEFLENIYNEMIPAFQSDFFNINCDETFDLGKEDSKQLVDSLGYGEVYYQHIMRLYDIVKKYDKRIIMWGDILMQYPELIKKLPKDVLIGTWNYDAKETFKEFIDPFNDSGHELWVVPGVLNSRRIYPDFDKAFKNIRVFIEEGYEAGATGVLNCFWDDGSTGLFSNDWYGAAYGADKSWNVFSNDSTFDKRYARGSLGSDDTYLFKAIRKLNELRFYELTDGMTDKFLFVKLIPEIGEEIKISIADLEICLNIVNEAQAELDKANLNNFIEDTEYLQFIIDLYRILVEERLDLLKAANLYKEAENDFTTNPSFSRSNILSTIEIVTKLISNQEYLMNQFKILWLKENHTYALDWITDKYQTKIDDFNSIKTLLLESLKRFDSSQRILSLTNVRLAISKLPGKYFTEWMMINPLPNKDMIAASDIDYLIDMGGETKANPKVTQEFYFDNEKYRWRRVVSEKQDIINLNKIFNYENQSGVMYAFANISTDASKEIEALVGGSNGIEVFINGQSISRFTLDELSPDQKKIILPLEKGKNNLLLKVTKQKGDWGFTFRLVNSEVRNSKNRYKIVNSEFSK